MVIGLGTDIQEISEIKNGIENKKFLYMVFCPSEIEYCHYQQRSYQHYAVRFAAKESAMKSLGCGWNKGVQWKDIEIIKNENEPPFIILHNRAKEIAELKGITKISLSMSHCDSYALAVVIMEKL